MREGEKAPVCGGGASIDEAVVTEQLDVGGVLGAIHDVHLG